MSRLYTNFSEFWPFYLREHSKPWTRTLLYVGTSLVVLIAVAANWLIAAAYVGGPMGLTPWESALRMGPHFAWTLLSLANGLGELIWLCIALLVGWRLGR